MNQQEALSEDNGRVTTSIGGEGKSGGGKTRGTCKASKT